MSQPNRTTTHIDSPLTDMSIGFFQDPSAFIAGIVLPTKPVSKQSDKYFVYDQGDFARDSAKLRKAGTESEGSGFSLSNDSYYCDKYALHVDLDYDQINEADVPLDLERDSAKFLAHQMLLRREVLTAAAIFGTGIWSTDVDGTATSQWSDFVGSSPVEHIDSAARAILLGSFNNPSTLLCGLDVYNALKNHPDINRNVLNPTPMDPSGIARQLGVDRVIVARAIKNSGVEGLADSNGFIFDPKSALLLSNPQTVGLMSPAAAIEFAWTGSSNLPRPKGLVSRRIDMPEKTAVRIETEMTHDVKVTGATMGVYFENIVA